MSSVSSTGSDYNYYQQQVSDLEDQNAKDRKKAEEREKERIADLERKYHKQVREDQLDSDRALSRSKEASNSALSSERQENKNEMERLKRDTYDRYGRASRDNTAEYRKNLDELENDLDHTRQRDKDDLRATRRAYEEALARRSENDEDRTRRTLDDMRAHFDEQRENALASSRAGYRGLAEESSRRFDDHNRELTKELSTERRLAGEALEDANRNYDRRLDLARKAYERNTNRQERDLRNALTDHANKLRGSHRRETGMLRDQIGDLIQAERNYEKSSAQGRSDAVGELENDWRKKYDSQQNAYEQQIADLKTQNDRTESYLSHQNYENMRGRDAFMARTIKESNHKHHQEMETLQDAALRDHEQMDALRQHDAKVAQELAEKRMHDAVVNSQESLAHQAQAMRDAEARQRVSDRAQLKRAESALQEQRTSSDTSLISPAAEAAIRRQIAGQYEKNAQADQTRNQRETERLRDEYRQELSDVLENDRVQDTHRSREITAERDHRNAQLASTVTEMESDKKKALSLKDEQNNRQTNRLTKNYTRLLNHANREREEQVDAIRENDTSKLDAFRDETAFNRKMEIREFNNRENKTIHDYEKKLSDQKTAYEDELADQKAQFDSQSREKERRYHQTLDQQSRAYEHRLAEQQAQAQERERFISQTYQDQIDRLKRSNQLLIQKRS